MNFDIDLYLFMKEQYENCLDDMEEEKENKIYTIAGISLIGLVGLVFLCKKIAEKQMNNNGY